MTMSIIEPNERPEMLKSAGRSASDKRLSRKPNRKRRTGCGESKKRSLTTVSSTVPT